MRQLANSEDSDGGVIFSWDVKEMRGTTHVGPLILTDGCSIMRAELGEWVESPDIPLELARRRE